MATEDSTQLIKMGLPVEVAPGNKGSTVAVLRIKLDDIANLKM